MQTTFTNIIAFLLAALVGLVASQQPFKGLNGDWSGWGANINNDRWVPYNNTINPGTIQSLTSRCSIKYPVGVAATPTTVRDMVYFPTWNGSFVALDSSNCKIVWSISVVDIITKFAPLTPFQMNYLRLSSRTSPVIQGNTLYFGTQAHALLVAVDRFTGRVISAIQVNNHPLAIITMSPTYYNGYIYIGASSVEEFSTFDADYKCCNFIGNFGAYKFNISSFTKVWSRDMLPQGSGWSGAGVWGSQASIDVLRNQVFIATGNTYTAPDSFVQCQNSHANNPVNPDGSDPCPLPTNIWQTSVISLDASNGNLKWLRQLGPVNSWTFACGSTLFNNQRDPAKYPQVPRLDADFGMAPAFVPESQADTPQERDVVVIGQKNGIIHAIRAQDGVVQWSKQVAPGSVNGGISWGIAVDTFHVFFVASNPDQVTFNLQGPSITTDTTIPVNNSAVGAIALGDGKFVWMQDLQGTAQGPPTVIGDLVLVPRTGKNERHDGRGAIVAFTTSYGQRNRTIEFDGVAGAWGGISVGGSNGDKVFVGTGYWMTPNLVGSLEILAQPRVSPNDPFNGNPPVGGNGGFDPFVSNPSPPRVTGDS